MVHCVSIKYDYTVEEVLEMYKRLDDLINQDCSFEEIPVKYKIEVAKCFSDADRYIPIQLNGIIGNTGVAKRLSINKKDIHGDASLVNISTIPPKTDLPHTNISKEENKIYGAGENV